MAKKGDMRLKAYYDFQGDYTVAVQEYGGFMVGWKNITCSYALHGRTEEDAIELARSKMNARKAVRLGVIE